ncbi:DMT family transporter [Azohydromonas caseinilytica]|uniref:DMT family transporter n=1 Tax=Azohydromonas caseinilytica TaxID=2728836 RepID=A0A848F7Z0_9BURK|nr:DMT family transporter [Azohydromonas caseinilytica]NML16237.1 DMT family transporter [Azohydromonas caseinilytica]
MSERKNNLDTRAVAAVLLCCGLWGLNQVATKVALAEIPPLLQAGLRSAGAAVLVTLWARWRGIALGGAPVGSWRGGLLAGALFAAEFGCVFIGLLHTSASRMVVFIYLAPFVVALGMPLIARVERLSRVQAAGLLVAFAGVAWAFGESFNGPAAAGSRQWLGDALGVLAAVLWGCTTLAIRGSRLSTAPAEVTLLYQLGVSGVLLIAASMLVGEGLPARVGALSLSMLGFQTVVVCFASYLLWFELLRRYPATKLSAFTLLTPVAGLGAGVLLLQEPLTARLLAAAAAVCVGIAAVNRPR